MDESAASLYSFCDYVHNERDKAKKTGPDVLAEFAYFLTNRGTGVDADKDDSNRELARLIETKQDILISLFGTMPNRVIAAKTKSLSLAPLPQIHSIKTYCDTRPVYDSSGNHIEAIVPIVTLSLITHGGGEDQKQLLVNLSQSDIKTIRSELGRLNRKLKALRSRYPEINPSKKKGQD